MFLIFLSKKVLGKKSCLVKVHEWKYEKKSVEAEFEYSHSHIKEQHPSKKKMNDVSLTVRRCSKCNKVEYTIPLSFFIKDVKWNPGTGPNKLVFRRI